MCSSSSGIVLGLRLNRRQGWKPKNQHGFAVTVCRCETCGLTYPDPLPIPQSIEDHYAIPPETYWTDDYFTLNDDYLVSELTHARQLLAGLPPPLKALDIGAAIGKGMLAMERAGFQAWGLEPSPTFRKMAISRLGIAPDRLQLTSVEDAIWPSNHYTLYQASPLLST